MPMLKAIPRERLNTKSSNTRWHPLVTAVGLRARAPPRASSLVCLTYLRPVLNFLASACKAVDAWKGGGGPRCWPRFARFTHSHTHTHVLATLR